jgi:hypothetical protein
MGGRDKRDEGSAGFWRLRAALEMIKCGVWIGFQWLRSGGPFGPF